ncbi:MAG TPA: SAM-dependent methyltransferase, partial [Steroidobacteraceae bacterium]|nr:SAM-dependent methyltransferase [Steroidobacteraceae bacterium]
YSAGGAKIGAGGDFTTAPELSDLFSVCVARQCAEVLEQTGGGILELGAGTGRMAATVLETLASLGTLPERYAILEVSADLRDRQRTRIEQLPERLRKRVVWFDRLPAKPFTGVVLANEVLDALPCRRLVVRDGAAHELGVAAADAGTPRGDPHEFVEVERTADPALAAAWERLTRELPYELPPDYRTELCLRVEPWIASLADCLERGVMLLFDYGLPRSHYYHPQRMEGTLRCHYKHRVHDDPFINVGVQDITAWVDFTRVAEAADAAGLQVRGFATQAAFLLGLGIESLVRDLRQSSEARQLLLPGEMGEAFKAIALAREVDAPLRGFSVQDLRHLL